MTIPLELLLIHAAGGFVGGLLALLVVPPSVEDPSDRSPVRQALARLTASVLASALFSGLALQVLPFVPAGFWPQLGLAGAIGVLAWWVLHAVLLYFRRRRDRDALEIWRDLKRGADDADRK